MNLESIESASQIWRVGRAPNAWSWPSWEAVGTDGTFGNRWDDPQSAYRVLYASSQRVACYVEVLSRFRKSIEQVAAEAAIEGDPRDSEFVDYPAATVPRSYLSARRVGWADLPRDWLFAHASTATNLQALRTHREIAAVATSLGVEIDAASVRSAKPRELTQAISRAVYEVSTAGAEPRYQGLAYQSRFGDEFQNWAIFETDSSTGFFGRADNPSFLCQAVDVDGDDDLKGALLQLELEVDDEH